MSFPKFRIDEKTIGIKGSIGEVWFTPYPEVRGVPDARDVICHMRIPGHWIFKTENAEESRKEYGPIGKKGPIELYDFQESDCHRHIHRKIVYWNLERQEIGWDGHTTYLEDIIDQFKAMGEFLSSDKAKAKFEALYETGECL